MALFSFSFDCFFGQMCSLFSVSVCHRCPIASNNVFTVSSIRLCSFFSTIFAVCECLAVNRFTIDSFWHIFTVSSTIVISIAFRRVILTVKARVVIYQAATKMTAHKWIVLVLVQAAVCAERMRERVKAQCTNRIWQQAVISAENIVINIKHT